MRDTFSLLRDLDFNCYVAEIKQMIANADPWLLGILVSMLVGVGHKIAIGHRVVYGWGLRLGALTFLCHAGYTLVRSGGLTENITAGLFARSAMVAGGVLAGVWILLPILLFVYVNFRFGLAGFLGYSGYALITAETLSSELLPGIALRGLLVAGLAMVLAWILRPIWEFLATICLAKSSTPSVPAKETDKPMVADPRLSRRDSAVDGAWLGCGNDEPWLPWPQRFRWRSRLPGKAKCAGAGTRHVSMPSSLTSSFCRNSAINCPAISSRAGWGVISAIIFRPRKSRRIAGTSKRPSANALGKAKRAMRI